MILWSHCVTYFEILKVLVVLHSEDPKNAVAGVWCTMFFIYMTYTLLALHIQVLTLYINCCIVFKIWLYSKHYQIDIDSF